MNQDAYSDTLPTQDARLILGQALMAQKERRHANAETLYRQVLALDPQLVSGRVRYAIFLVQRGQPGEAEKEWDQALQLDPSAAASRLEDARSPLNEDAILSLRGLTETRQGKHVSAQEWLEQALKLNPDNVAALVWLAQSLVKTGELAKAERYVSCAQALVPEDATAKATAQEIEQVRRVNMVQELVDRARAEVSQGRLDEAEKLFEQARQLQPTDTMFQREYARLLFKSQRYSEAVEYLERALALAPHDQETHRMLDEAKAVLNRQHEASQLVEEGQTALRADQYEEALRLAEAALARTPGLAQALVLKADAQAAQLRDQLRKHFVEANRHTAAEDYQGAIAELKAAQQLLPGDEQIQERLNAAEEKLRNYHLSADSHNKALQKAKDGEIQEALKLMERAVQLNPDSDSLRQARQKLEQQSQAMQLLSQARALIQSNPLSALELVNQAQGLAPDLQGLETVRAQAQDRIDASSKVEQSLRRASEQRQAGRLREACQSVLAALEAYPGELRLQDALKDIERELDAQVQQLLREGQAALEAGQWEEAQHKAETALAESPTSAEAQALRAKAQAFQIRDRIRQHLIEADRLMSLEDWQSAADELEAARQLRPDEEALKQVEATEDTWRTRRHQAQQQLEQQSKAMQLLSQARALIEGDPAAALDLAQQAQTLAPDLEGIEAVTAEAQARTKAKDQLDRVLRLATERRLAGQWIEARQVLRDALLDRPDEPKLEEALKDIQQGLDAHVQELFSQGRAAEQGGDLEKAIRLYEQVLSLAPERVEAQNALAALTQLLKNQAEAHKLLREAQERYQAGEYAEAEQTLRRALNLTPDDRTLQSTLRQWEQERIARDIAKQGQTPAPPLPEPTPAPMPPPSEIPPPTLAPQEPDAAVRYYAAQAVKAWHDGDRIGCLAAARQSYELAIRAKQAQDVGLQCGLVWLGLTWAALPKLSRSEADTLQQAAARIDQSGKLLQANYNARLLSHIAREMIAHDIHRLEVLTWKTNTPDDRDRSLIERVSRYASLDNEARQKLAEELASRSSGELGALVLHTIMELLRRRT